MTKEGKLFIQHGQGRLLCGHDIWADTQMMEFSQPSEGHGEEQCRLGSLQVQRP